MPEVALEIIIETEEPADCEEEFFLEGYEEMNETEETCAARGW